MIQFKPTKHTKFIKIKNNDWKPSFSTKIECPTCKLATIKRQDPKWIGRCEKCGHIHSFFYPTPPQAVITQIRAKILNVFGGTGSGKTTASSALISEHMRNVPGIKVMAFAQTKDQLKQTGVMELDKFFFENEWKVRNADMWIHNNGSVITWYTSNSEQVIRGANIGIAWLIEASGIDIQVQEQVQSRTRQDDVKIIVKDENGDPVVRWDGRNSRWEVVVLEEFGMTLIETNPTFEWPRESGLLQSHTILYTESVRGIEKIAQLVEPKADPEDPEAVLDKVSILFASPDNPLMTKEYLSTIRTNYETPEEYERDVYCNMAYMTGMIYGKHIDKIFTDNDELKVDGEKTYFMESIDPGGAAKGNDETAYILAKVKTNTNSSDLPEITIIDGYKKSGLITSEEAENIWKVRNQYGWDLMRNFKSVVDPGGAKNDKKTGSNIIKDLRVRDVYLTKEGVNTDVDWGIKRVQMFMEAGKLKIIGGTEFAKALTNEIKTYVWTDKKTKSKMQDEIVQKPVDRNNHIMDAMRFLCVSVPIHNDAVHKFQAGNNIDEYQNWDRGSKKQITTHDRFDMREDTKSNETSLTGSHGIYYEM